MEHVRYIDTFPKLETHSLNLNVVPLCNFIRYYDKTYEQTFEHRLFLRA